MIAPMTGYRPAPLVSRSKRPSTTGSQLISNFYGAGNDRKQHQCPVARTATKAEIQKNTKVEIQRPQTARTDVHNQRMANYR